MNRNALEQLFDECRTQLVQWIRRFLRNGEDAEDVAQEAFARCYQRLLDRDLENPRAYVFTAARNLAIKQNNLAANKLRSEMDDLGLAEVITIENPVFQASVAKEEMASLCEAISSLPAQCRRVFVLKKVYGFTHKEIAARLAISENTVHQHLAKGVSRCAVYMRESGHQRGKLRLVSKRAIQK